MDEKNPIIRKIELMDYEIQLISESLVSLSVDLDKIKQLLEEKSINLLSIK